MTSLVVPGLCFREATLDDKATVLSLRKNVYRGLDYLPAYYEYFLGDPRRRCIIGEMDKAVVCFGVMNVIDGGRTVVGQAGRVHERYERWGIFSALTRYLNAQARLCGCSRRVALVETTLNKYARSERFREAHTEICTKLHYAGVITDTARNIFTSTTGSREPLSQVGIHTVRNFIMDADTNRYLFPSNSILLDYIPFRAMEANAELLSGRNVTFYSTVKTLGGIYSGLLSAGSSYKSMRPPMSYTIDIFGKDSSDLRRHVTFHLSKAMTLTDGDCCIQIFIENGHMSQELCKVLISYAVSQCHWYIEGGISIKSVVKEVL